METIGFGNLKRNSPNGIEFVGDKRELYFQGEKAAQGKLKGTFEPRDYFYRLLFLDDFPQVGLWAFGDAWTQRFKILPPKRDAAGALSGVIYFSGEERENSRIYIVEEAYDSYPLGGLTFSPPWVYAPLPPLFDTPLNLPLRLIIARAVTAALDDDWPYDQWRVVTSTLEREQVPKVFAADVALAYGFRLKGFSLNLRQALCEAQGLRG